MSEITYPIPAVGTKSRSGSKRLWLWFRLAFKELLNHRRFSIFFILNLSLGLAGFIALDSFQVSLDRHLTRNSKSILGADISISSGNLESVRADAALTVGSLKKDSFCDHGSK